MHSTSFGLAQSNSTDTTDGTVTVCVTGAAGFLGTHLVAQLLEKGYTVHATVRRLRDTEATECLRKLAAALPGNLKLYKADLLTPGSFDDAVKGCKYVFHTASPLQLDVPDPQKDLIDPAVQGSRTVLESVINNQRTVKRVVMTSSVAAVHGEYAAPPKSGDLYTDQDWNETSSIEGGQAYHLSKTLAEREAWATAKAAGIDLVTICPNFTLGPPLSPRADGLSVGACKGWLEGQAPSGTPIICDVRDVACAHVLAAEQPSASGRYLVSHRDAVLPQCVADTLQTVLRDLDTQHTAVEGNPEKIDNSRLDQLGLVIRPATETLADMARVLIAFGIAQPHLKKH